MTPFIKQLRAWRRQKAREIVSPDYIQGMNAAQYGELVLAAVKRRQDAQERTTGTFRGPDVSRGLSENRAKQGDVYADTIGSTVVLTVSFLLLAGWMQELL